jgi:hypothetical protein
MSKTREPRKTSQSEDAGNSPETTYVPLKPRRGLFILMGIILILLLAGLLGLYFKTVYPFRTLPHPTERDQPPTVIHVPAH